MSLKLGRVLCFLEPGYGICFFVFVLFCHFFSSEIGLNKSLSPFPVVVTNRDEELYDPTTQNH